MGLHVGLDLLFLVPGESGGRESYARGLLGALRWERPDLRITAFLNRETVEAGPGFWSDLVDRAVVLPRASARARIAWATAELASVPVAAAHAGVDVLHSPANFGPPAGPFGRVLTLHDLMYRAHPELLPRAMRWGTEVLVPLAARRAHVVLTVSAASRDDIVRYLRVAPKRIVVVPNGIEPPGRPGDAGAGRARLRAVERPILLSVASDLPHKNLPALLNALALLPAGQRPLLALAGYGTDTGALPARAARLGVDGDVRLLGAVSTEELEDLYAAASGLVTASRWEGFGLPVLEALIRGVPVACSDLAVFREIAGGFAELFSPHDPAAIAAAFKRLAAESVDASAVSRQGASADAARDHAARFTWAAAARATAAAYERAAEAAAREPSRPARASA